MHVYSDHELEQMLGDIESNLVERKEAWTGSAPEKARQAVCAFANDLPDHRDLGVIVVGVRDDGVPSGLAVTDQLLQTLADIRTDGNILPPPSISVQKRRLLGADMAVVTVQPADAPPVRYQGRTWVRIGPRRAQATAQDERILAEKRRFKDLPFDARPLVSCGIDQLSRLAFEEEYLRNAFAPDVLQANVRTYEQQLSACKMVDTPDSAVPTALGVLVLGKVPTDWIPGAYVQFLRIAGSGLADPIVDAADIRGRVGRIVTLLDEKLSSHNRVAVDLVSGPIERRTYTYPVAALQQITRNAIMHRAYEGTNAPVRVSWFDDRVEVQNSGGVFGSVTPETFGHPGVTDYRNPNLAEAMKVLGCVQKFGAGIATANRAMLDNGNPEIVFTIEQTHVLAVLKSRESTAANV